MELQDYKNKISEKFNVIDFSNIKIIPKIDPRETQILFSCNKHGKTKRRWQAINVSGNFGCKKCLTFNKYFKIFQESLKKFNYVIESGEYKGTKEKFEIKCIEHNIIFTTTPHHFHTRNKICPECWKIKWRNVYKEDFIKKATKIHKGFYKYDHINYQTTRELVDIICPNHGIFQQSPDCHMQGQKCLKCTISYRENFIKELLNKYDIEYIFNKGHKLLINPKTGYMLKPDFWLEKFNLIIEYDGEHHFKQLHTKEIFDNVQYLDKLKNDLCKKHKIKLWRFNKSNVYLLDSKLKKLIKPND